MPGRIRTILASTWFEERMISERRTYGGRIYARTSVGVPLLVNHAGSGALRDDLWRRYTWTAEEHLHGGGLARLDPLASVAVEHDRLGVSAEAPAVARVLLE